MLQQIDSAIAFAVVMLALSLIITALVQIVTSCFDVRGLNLVWALTRLFHQVDPAFAKKLDDKKWYELFSSTMGRRLAQAVSRYKPLATGIVGRAKALRSDELLLVLQQIAKNPPANLPDGIQAELVRVLRERVPGGSNAKTAEALTMSLAQSLDPALRDQLKTRLEDAVRNTVGSISKMEHQVNQWFDAVMDRSSDIFSAHSKVYTFVFAAVLALGWHIDAGQIFHQISTDGDVRDNLNRAADSVIAQGDKLVQSNHVTAAFRDLYDHSKDLSKTLESTSSISCADNGEAWLKTNASKLPPYEDQIQEAIASACAKDSKNPDLAGALRPVLDDANKAAPQWLAAPSGLERCSDGIRWIQSPGSGISDPDASASEFQKQCQMRASSSLGEVGDGITQLRRTLEGSKLTIATTLLRYDGREVSIRPFRVAGYGYWPHLLGTLATVLLLSLGAPFWFNTLQQLSNLKPAVAQKIEDEGAAEGDEEVSTEAAPVSAKAAGTSGG